MYVAGGDGGEGPEERFESALPARPPAFVTARAPGARPADEVFVGEDVPPSQHRERPKVTAQGEGAQDFHPFGGGRAEPVHRRRPAGEGARQYHAPPPPLLRHPTD